MSLPQLCILQLCNLAHHGTLPLALSPNLPVHTFVPWCGRSGRGPFLLAPNMRISSAAQYNPAAVVPVTLSSSPRVQAHRPTYITSAPAPTPINPAFTSTAAPEEVCMECAIRDQDMADVDVTSPGVWAHESDVHYVGASPRPNEWSKPYMPSTNPCCPTPKRRLAHASRNNNNPSHAARTVHRTPLTPSIELKSPKVCSPLLRLCSPYANYASLIRPPTQVSWFLAPTVALARQQQAVIASHLPISVGLISGVNKPDQWCRVLKTPCIIVSTPTSHAIRTVHRTVRHTLLARAVVMLSWNIVCLMLYVPCSSTVVKFLPI
jgi:hypothetical protein